MTPEASPTPGFLFTLLIVGAVVITMLLEGHWRKVLVGVIAAILIVGFFGVAYFSKRKSAVQHQAVVLRADKQARAEYFVTQGRAKLEGKAPRMVASIEKAVHHLEVPDDLAAWQRDAALAFEKGCDWQAAEIKGMSRGDPQQVGDTLFTLWEPSSTSPSTTRFVGFSGKEPTPEAALEGARESARRKLAAMALYELKVHDPRFPVLASESLARRLAGSRDVYREEDAHEESAVQPYGTLHRAAVLVKADAKYIERLKTAIRSEVARGTLEREKELRSWVVFAGAALLGGLVLFLVYTFANAGTKGYFAWPLRGAALAFFVVLILALHYARRHEFSTPAPAYYMSPASPAPAPAR